MVARVEVHARGRVRVHREHHAAELDSSAAGRSAYRLMNVRACARRVSIAAGLMLREAASPYPVNTYCLLRATGKIVGVRSSNQANASLQDLTPWFCHGFMSPWFHGSCTHLSSPKGVLEI